MKQKDKSLILSAGNKSVCAGNLALAGLLGIGYEMSLCGGNRSVSGDFFLVLLWAILYKAYLKTFSEKRGKGFYLLVGILAVLFSSMLIVGGVFDSLKQESDIPGYLMCGIVLLAMAVYPLLAVLTMVLDEYTSGPHQRTGNRKMLRLCFVMVVIVWGGTYLALFPGVYGTDAPYWYYEFSTKDVPISSQWSPFYCAFFYGLVKLGMALFHSSNAGFAVFSFVQMVFVLFVVWKMLEFLNRYNHIAVILAAAFFTVIPTHVILALTSAQDPVFAACFAMCVMELFKMLANPKEYCQRRKIVGLVVWLILLCMVRNNGLYAVLIMGAFALLVMKGRRKQMLLVSVVPIVVCLVCQGPVYDALGIQKGTAIREMLSLPLQQMAYAYNHAYEKLSLEAREAMLTYIPDEGWRSYEPCISDHVKGVLNTEKVKSNLLDFGRLYISVFSSAPGCYIKGAGYQTYGLWYPNKTWPDYRTWHPWIEYVCSDVVFGEESIFTVTRDSLCSWYENILGILYGKGENHSGYGGDFVMQFSKIPGLGTLSNAGIYFWMIIYMFFYAIYRKWKAPLVIIGFGVGMLVTVFLSPVILYRYCAPVIFAAPLFVALFLENWEEKSADGIRG